VESLLILIIGYYSGSVNSNLPVTSSHGLGMCLREARRRRGLSQAELARALGISQSYVSEMETGKDSLAIARVFDFMRMTGLILRAEFVDASPHEAAAEPEHSALEEACRRYGIAELAIVGSVARGDAGDDSDIDLVYTLLEGAHLGWSINDLSDDLERIFGRQVDLVSKSSLNPLLKESMLVDAMVIYAA